MKFVITKFLIGTMVVATLLFATGFLHRENERQKAAQAEKDAFEVEVVDFCLIKNSEMNTLATKLAAPYYLEWDGGAHGYVLANRFEPMPGLMIFNHIDVITQAVSQREEILHAASNVREQYIYSQTPVLIMLEMAKVCQKMDDLRSRFRASSRYNIDEIREEYQQLKISCKELIEGAHAQIAANGIAS